MAGAFRFELKTSVLETGILPIETTRLKVCKALTRLERVTSSFGNLRSLIPSELQSRKNWSERRDLNPQLSVWKTATQPFEFRSHLDLGFGNSDLGLK